MKMEKLKFTIEDSQIAELLGRQNFSSKESAVFELIKNSYDAGAETCEVFIGSDSIKIIDTGKGMDESDVKLHWMHIGKSSKGYMDPENNRILTGSKGVGRFALARLGNDVTVISKKADSIAVIWETDWVTSGLVEAAVDFNKGTKIEILGLRDKWRKKDIDVLTDFLRRAYKSKSMEINIYFQDDSYTINSIFDDVVIGVNYVSKVRLYYDSNKMELSINIQSDEFKQNVMELVGSDVVRNLTEKYNMQDELKLVKDNEDNKLYLKELGDFCAEFYFVLERQAKAKAEEFSYKYNGLDGIKTGIVLYRNDFSISSLDGNKDWLDIASRARKSPAAATHPTGSWRVRLNQLSGFVKIDKEENSNLKDLANRQGLEEDEYYQMIKEIISFGIGRFEKNRQSIIRKIVEKNETEKIKRKEEKNKIKEFLKKPSNVSKMSKQELVSLATEIKDVQREVKEQSKIFKESELKHKYDVRILNVLATQGLRASAIAHELQNQRNALSSGYEDIVGALKEYGYWDELNSDEYTKVSYKNVPKTLASLEEVNFKLITFLNIILNKIEKNKFSSKIESIRDLITKTKEIWQQQYNWIDFEINIFEENNRKYNFSDDVIEVILDNLILNSIQHNELRNRLNIKIIIEAKVDIINLKYSDDGVGLHGKYKKDPKRILEVHETSRNDGHGLGMWIVNNTTHMYGGGIDEINGENGFNIELTLKG